MEVNAKPFCAQKRTEPLEKIISYQICIYRFLRTSSQSGRLMDSKRQRRQRRSDAQFRGVLLLQIHLLVQHQTNAVVHAGKYLKKIMAFDN